MVIMIKLANIDQQNKYQNRISPNFRANINSPKLKLSSNEFYIRIRGYGKNENWAKVIKETTDTSVNLIRCKCGFDNLLRYITSGVIKANSYVFDIAKKQHTGILRAERKDYKYGSDWFGLDIVTYYDKINKYKIYQERLNQIKEQPLKNPYKEIDLTRPLSDKKGEFLIHGSNNKVNSGLDLLEKKYKSLLEKYNPEDVSTKDLGKILNIVSEMRWLLAHITPWERGSDAISNVLMRSLLKAMGIKSSQSAKNISFDMEAYCTDLKEYQKNFQNFFETPPVVIE